MILIIAGVGLGGTFYTTAKIGGELCADVHVHLSSTANRV
jgi:hypothetical protein